MGRAAEVIMAEPARRAPSRDELIREDMRDLHRLGYAQQLYREMGGFSNFAISFSIISILTGAIQLFGYGLQFAGPVINTYGWPLVSVFVLCVAASMAELASAYPTAGGLYFWAHRLGGAGWAWITAWFNMIGQVTITAGIDYAAAQYIVGAVNRIAGTASADRHRAATVVAMVADHDPADADQRLRHPAHRAAERFQRLLAHRRRAAHRRAAHRARPPRAAAGVSVHSTSRPCARPTSARSFAVGPWTLDSLMLRLPGCRRCTPAAASASPSCSACCRRSGRTPATTPRRTSPRRR